jgi:hypothetical protein
VGNSTGTKLCSVSGVEIGKNPKLGSFQKRHVHIALCLANYTSVRSVITKLRLKEFDGYYCAARNKRLPIDGWRNYHYKMDTKVEPKKAFLVCIGSWPREYRKKTEEQKISEHKADSDKKRKMWDRRKHLAKMNMMDEMDEEFPGFQYSTAGRYMIMQCRRQMIDEKTRVLDKLDNYIIWGPSGTGKSSSVAYLYPKCYKKQKGTQYWDRYDKYNKDHEIVWIDEMSKETLETLTGKQKGGFDFLKELADRYPVCVDEKYRQAELIRPKKLIITMNSHPTTLLPDEEVMVNKEALYRKFKIMHVADWLTLNDLKCTDNGVVPLTETENYNIWEKESIAETIPFSDLSSDSDISTQLDVTYGQ